MSLDYKIEITPLIFNDVYGDTVDVSDYVTSGGIGSIKKQLDQGQYEIGKFIFNSISLTMDNKEGKFNEPDLDVRSIFPYQRDRAKVEITFINKTGAEDISYKGLITDKTTRQDLNNQTVSFTLLSYDSVLKQDEIFDGAIKTGSTFSDAIQVILSTSFITSVLNYNPLDINPTIDLAIDDGSKFNGLISKSALDLLLQASNSIFLIDDDDNMIVRSRADNANTPHEFYKNDQFKRDNIKSIANYNNGLQRMFNSVLINDTREKDQTSIDIYKVREKRFVLNFMTDNTKESLIADSVLGTFGRPKIEMDLITDRETSTDIEFLDLATVSKQPLITKPKQGFPAIYDADEWGKSYWAVESYDLLIFPSTEFKVIANFEDVNTFNTTFRLREI